MFRKLLFLALVLGFVGAAQAAVYTDDFEGYALADPWDTNGVADWDYAGGTGDKATIEDDVATGSRIAKIYEVTDTDPSLQFVAPPNPAVDGISLYSAQFRCDRFGWD